MKGPSKDLAEGSMCCHCHESFLNRNMNGNEK